MHWGPAVSKLRWTLLILGGAFILALGLWERWRPRHARGRAGKRQITAPGELPADQRERPQASNDSATDGTDAGAAHGGARAQTRVASEQDRPWSVHSDGLGMSAASGELSADGGERGASEPWIGEPGLAEVASSDSEPRAERQSHRVMLAADLDESPTAELPVLTEVAVDVPAQRSLEETAALEPPAPEALIVQWPPEQARRIVALRLVAASERFPGRAVRLALAAEGFQLGRFDIFHKPDEARRAVVSVASLTRPGTFDLGSMDSQRYPGLSLFVVLPGPRPGQHAFDELVDVAQNLCERLQGELQDERGAALTEESVRTLRASLSTGADGPAP